MANTIEQQTSPAHPSVGEVIRQHDALVLHGIGDEMTVQQNGILMGEHADFMTKLEICLAFEPTLAASMISPLNPDRATARTEGLIIVDGKIDSIYDFDAATVVASADDRSSRALNKQTVEQVLASEKDSYNEVIVDDPVFGGLFWRPHQVYNVAIRAKIPQYLITASQKFGFPIFIIDEQGAALPVTTLDELGNYKTGEPAKPADISAVEATIDKEKAQDELLARSVFRVAHRERGLVSASEQGRLAYFVEQNDPADLLAEGEAARFKMTWATGMSDVIKILRQNDVIILEKRQDGGASGKGKGKTEISQDLSELKHKFDRVLFYLPQMPYIGDDTVNEHYGVPSYFESSDLSNSLLDIVDRHVQAAQRVIADPSAVNYTGGFLPPDETMKLYLETTGFFLNGYADEAERHGDLPEAERARTIADGLIEKEKYQDLRTKRLAEDGSFRLTRQDLPSSTS